MKTGRRYEIRGPEAVIRPLYEKLIASDPKAAILIGTRAEDRFVIGLNSKDEFLLAKLQSTDGIQFADTTTE